MLMRKGVRHFSFGTPSCLRRTPRWQFGVRRVVALAVARRALTLNHCLESFAVSIPLFDPSSWAYVYLCLLRKFTLVERCS